MSNHKREADDFAKILEEIKEAQATSKQQWNTYTSGSSTYNGVPLSGSSTSPFFGGGTFTPNTTSGYSIDWDARIAALEESIKAHKEYIDLLEEKFDLLLDALEYIQMMRG